VTKDQLNEIDKNMVLLVDIREPEELCVTPTVPGAINIPMSKLGEVIGTLTLPQDKKIVTICRSGGRCFMVNQVLKAHGYDVDYLEGGVISL